MTTLIKAATLSCLGFLLSSSCYAQNWYGGIGIGSSSIDTSSYDLTLADFSIPGLSVTSSVSDDDSGIKLFAGYNVNKNLAIEFGFMDLGDILEFRIRGEDTDALSPTFGDVTTINSTTSVDGIFGSAVYQWPLSNTISFKGKLGMLFWNADASGSYVVNSGGSIFESSGTVSDDGQDLTYGIELDINWIGFEYEVYQLEDEDIEYIGVKATYNF